MITMDYHGFTHTCQTINHYELHLKQTFLLPYYMYVYTVFVYVYINTHTHTHTQTHTHAHLYLENIYMYIFIFYIVLLEKCSKMAPLMDGVLRGVVRSCFYIFVSLSCL